ncbi:MAG: hypothetical protein ACRERR_13955 [Moraxellaceae bacterium]
MGDMSVLDKLKGVFLTPVAYVQIFSNRLLVSIPARGVRVEGTADFSHPRMLIGKFVEAERLLTELLKEVYGKSLLPQRPVVIVHPKEILNGGLADIEERALMELALGAGARQAKIWQGEDLTVETISKIRP